MEERQAPSAESLARGAWQRGDYAAVTDIVFSAYGSELYSFLLAQFRGQASIADDVFSAFSEDYWRGLPGFEWRCSIRAWCYKLARSASSRYRRSPHNRRERQVPLSEAGELEVLVARTRTNTQVHLRSEVKDKFRELREALSRDEQDLLVLRVDRALPWRDVVHAMFDEQDVTDEQQCRRLETALRQRFSEVKKRLRRLAKARGLL